MEKNYIISKCDDSEFCFQPQGNSLIVLLDNDEKVCVLNETYADSLQKFLPK